MIFTHLISSAHLLSTMAGWTDSDDRKLLLAIIQILSPSPPSWDEVAAKTGKTKEAVLYVPLNAHQFSVFKRALYTYRSTISRQACKHFKMPIQRI